MDLHVFVHNDASDRLDRILKLLEQIMATLDQVLADVTAEKTDIASIGTLIAGLKQQLADALAGVTLPPGTQAKVYADAGSAATGVGGVAVKSTTGTSADVYLSLIFAMNAFGIVPLRGNAIKTFLKPRGSSGIADPLDQVGTLGWKAKTTQVILNDNFMTRIESSASA